MKSNIQYPSAKVVLRRPSDNKILLLARTIDMKVGFEPAGGKVESDFVTKTSETFENCAMREIKEELGIEAKITHYIGSYFFFWSIQENTSSHCVLFLADILSSNEITAAQQDACGHVSPVWVSISDIKARSIPVRDYHVGLEDLLVKAVNIIEPA